MAPDANSSSSTNFSINKSAEIQRLKGILEDQATTQSFLAASQSFSANQSILRDVLLDSKHPSNQPSNISQLLDFNIVSQNVSLKKDLDAARNAILLLLTKSASVNAIPTQLIWRVLSFKLSPSNYFKEILTSFESLYGAAEEIVSEDDIDKLFKSFRIDNEADKEESKKALEREKRAHNVLKHEMFALESDLRKVTLHAESLESELKQRQEDAISKQDVITLLEEKVEGLENHLVENPYFYSNLDKARDDYVKLQQSNDRSEKLNNETIGHLKHFIENELGTKLPSYARKLPASHSTRNADEQTSKKGVDAELDLYQTILQVENARIMNERNAAFSHIQALEQEIDDLKLLSHPEHEVANLLTKLTLLQDDHGKLSECLSSVTNDLEMLREDYIALRNQHELVQIDNRKLADAMVSQKREIRAKDGLLKDFAKKMEAMAKINAEASSKLKQAMLAPPPFKAQFFLICLRLTQHPKKRYIRTSQGNKDAIIKDLREKQAKYAADLDSLRQDLEQAQNVKDSLKRFKADLQRKEKSMKDLKAKLDSTIAELETERAQQAVRSSQQENSVQLHQRLVLEINAQKKETEAVRDTLRTLQGAVKQHVAAFIKWRSSMHPSTDLLEVFAADGSLSPELEKDVMGRVEQLSRSLLSVSLNEILHEDAGKARKALLRLDQIFQEEEYGDALGSFFRDLLAE
ncbi:hypothetical protein HDV05_005969 [Chytridiales sp. JEL 0842]|nr:hypothetical protein HDV05_005969 [Chytridiales sp. JEL 0842]